MLFRFNNAYKSMNPILEPEGNLGTLWLGDYTAAINQQLLKQKGIKTVLTVASGLNIKYPPGSDIVHKVYNILDIESCNIKRIFADTYEQIQEGLQRGSVLVHCAAGVSRSASTVIAYLMKSKGYSFTEAMQFVRMRRSVICPNFGFQRQLKQYERELGLIKGEAAPMPLQPTQPSQLPGQRSASQAKAPLSIQASAAFENKRVTQTFRKGQAQPATAKKLVPKPGLK